MTSTVQAYKDKQTQLTELLNILNSFIRQGNEFGLELPNEMHKKLDYAIQSVSNEKLKVALIGGFSEGKTSIAAAWLGKLDKSTMKISASESSNEVSVYDIGNECILIDTPGLYGYKEQENNDFELEKYKDITKKYVSEAHIILYVMNSKNPIKESHKDDLIWLFKELNLLSRTVFVLSRFDEVADVEDEYEYQHFLKIKQANVISRLDEILELSSSEKESLKIVGVSANPFDEGIEYWLQNQSEFEKLSHISKLQKATTEIVQHNGGLENIANETKKSIFKDILLQEIPKIESKHNELIKINQSLDHLFTIHSHEISTLKNKINAARSNIKIQINAFFGDLLMQINGLGLETAQDFFDVSIGKDGIILTSSVNQIFLNETTSVSTALNQQIVLFDSNLTEIDSTASKLMKQGINHIVKNIKLDNTTVLAARNSLSSLSKMVGLDISKSLNFKPYGAIKFAEKINGIFAALGVVMEIIDSYKKIQAENQFKEAISTFKEDLKEQQKNLLTIVDSDQFIPIFFEGYTHLESALQNLNNQKQINQERQEKFNTWKEQGTLIEAKFREIL